MSRSGEKTSKQLRAAIKDKRMFKHLEALATIATENGGNRASGFQGYGASAQYILTELRAAGYRPTVQTFNFVTFEELSDPTLQAAHADGEDVRQAASSSR